MSASTSLAEDLNQRCDCSVADLPTLRRDLQEILGADFRKSLEESHPNLLSATPVFLDRSNAVEMRRLIDAAHRVMALPGYRAAVLDQAPAIARLPQAAAGAFTAFDFHINAEGPRLIEINTNAGGALLNAAALALQTSCCTEFDSLVNPVPSAEQLVAEMVSMFVAEWRLARADRPLRSIAIVDDEPRSQYLYPEFVLFKRSFEKFGYEVTIANATELELVDGELRHAGRRIDLVYNRLTDFYLADPRHHVLRRAYEDDMALVTPHPRAHALLANKQNLALLTDRGFLQSIGTSGEDLEALLRCIPRTLLVDGPPERWWNERKSWFFKPLDGFGGHGAYRGDKMTRRVFAEVMRGGYVAQAYSAPGVRRRNGGHESFKLDVRCYVYDGRIQLLAARLYQGQTTNFRTTGGGFAPVFEISSRVTAADLKPFMPCGL